MRLIPFKAEHIELIGGRESDGRNVVSKDHIRSAEITAFTLQADDESLVCASGVYPGPWKGIGTSWAVSSPLVPKYARDVLRFGRETTSHALKYGGYWRLETFVLADFEAGRRFAEHVGFELECIKKNYGPNREDYAQYAMVK